MPRRLLNAFSKEYWQKWLNKFFSLFISVKILWTILFTSLLICKYIGETTFKVLLLAVIATRGVIEYIAIKKNNVNDEEKEETKRVE